MTLHPNDPKNPIPKPVRSDKGNKRPLSHTIHESLLGCFHFVVFLGITLLLTSHGRYVSGLAIRSVLSHWLSRLTKISLIMKSDCLISILSPLALFFLRYRHPCTSLMRRKVSMNKPDNQSSPFTYIPVDVRVENKQPTKPFFFHINTTNSCSGKLFIVILQCNYKTTMGVTKTDLFTFEQNELAKAAKVLAHPARIAIVQHLMKERRCINSDLVQETGLAQATISQHLRELKDQDLIQGTIEGVSISYCINPAKWAALRDMFFTLFDTFPKDDPNSCC